MHIIIAYLWKGIFRYCFENVQIILKLYDKQYIKDIIKITQSQNPKDKEPKYWLIGKGIKNML